MKQSQYYIRLRLADESCFNRYLLRNNISGVELSRDSDNIGTLGASILYSMRLTDEEVTAMKLSFRFIGFLNFNRRMESQIGII